MPGRPRHNPVGGPDRIGLPACPNNSAPQWGLSCLGRGTAYKNEAINTDRMLIQDQTIKAVTTTMGKL